MKYQPKHYATALIETLGKKITAEREERVIKKFLELVRKNSDGNSLRKIVSEAEKLIRTKTGKRKVEIESARALTLAQKKSLLHFTHAEDTIEEKVNPELIAGVKITIDEESQLDFSLRRKLDGLFHY
ncbi:MAG TPA: F0F1 ATP synthase subunit delta [Candidatus Paceibacterota bacterium]